MGLLSPAPWSPVTPSTDRATIAARLTRLNAEVMTMRRRGYVATRSDAFEVQHNTISLLLYQWQQATH